MATRITGAGIGTGLTCATATSGCPNLSSGPGILDGAKVTNQTVLGLRYQGILGGVGILGYAAWEHSGTVNYTGLRTACGARHRNCGAGRGYRRQHVHR